MGKVRAVGLACLLVAVLVGPGMERASADSTTARIMLVGDSVTAGKAGDYTWRYRLWKTLQARGKSVDFVGPRTDLADGSTEYADPAFDQDHAARWGAMLTMTGWWVIPYPVDVTQDLVATYAPDIVIEDLGINNLIFAGATPDEVIALVEGFVADVRAANADATVVLGQLTQTWALGGTEVDAYNALLSDLASTLDQPDARVLVAPVPADYSIADTYDGSHPNAAGEIKIAKQFADVLATLPLPDKPAPAAPRYAGAATVSAHPRLRAVRLDFSVPAGATKQAIWRRNVTRDGRWRLVAYVGPRADHYRVGSLRPRHRYAFKLRAYRGAEVSTRYSETVRARAR
jgi:hypothetical protein